ncbi:NADH-quinone oxidoreductase subunit NuoN [Azospira sp. APE16]|uniref:NADH-quinone oxidoreductase subunit NuoN n=1 Tax=Azospira sp. APE16 TaxID=3394231 RepID=UPI001B5762C2|nr:NADH-quinone oxidoreductase subunit NuoN [Azospira sp.]
MLTNFVIPDLLPAAPELFILAMACVILIVDLFVKSKARTLTFALTQLTLVGCAAITYMTSTGEITYTFSNMFVDDLMADLLKLFLDLTVIVVLFYARGYIAERVSMAKGEFYVLVLLATLGMMVMISANHLLTLYLGLEMMSLSVYAMVALNRDSTQATEAAMKYFVLGALASGLLLYGISMVYGATGTLEITQVAQALAQGAVNKTILIFGLVFLVAGIAFKLGVVPFHMWIPDVYHGAPTPVTLFIASAPKLAAFAMVIRLLVNGLFFLAPDWQQMLMILAVLSMAIGNLAAIAQTNIKRMLAYSAISHMGFMLLGMVSGVVGGDARFALNAYSSSMFYMVAYVITSVAGFGMILLLARAGFEADSLDDFKGLNKRSPWFASMMMVVMLSMAGIPFFVGFFAKFAVLQAVVAAGYMWLAIAAVLFSLIGAFYYLRVVKLMYFDAPLDETPIASGFDTKLLLSANGLAVALLGLFPQTLMYLCAVALVRSL